LDYWIRIVTYIRSCVHGKETFVSTKGGHLRLSERAVVFPRRILLHEISYCFI
jgi:hypothetical protein